MRPHGKQPTVLPLPLGVLQPPPRRMPPKGISCGRRWACVGPAQYARSRCCRCRRGSWSPTMRGGGAKPRLVGPSPWPGCARRAARRATRAAAAATSNPMLAAPKMPTRGGDYFQGRTTEPEQPLAHYTTFNGNGGSRSTRLVFTHDPIFLLLSIRTVQSRFDWRIGHCEGSVRLMRIEKQRRQVQWGVESLRACRIRFVSEKPPDFLPPTVTTVRTLMACADRLLLMCPPLNNDA